MKIKAKDLIEALKKVDGEAPVYLDESLGFFVTLAGTVVRQYTDPNGDPIVVLELDYDAETSMVYEQFEHHKKIEWNE